MLWFILLLIRTAAVSVPHLVACNGTLITLSSGPGVLCGVSEPPTASVRLCRGAGGSLLWKSWGAPMFDSAHAPLYNFPSGGVMFDELRCECSTVSSYKQLPPSANVLVFTRFAGTPPKELTAETRC